MKPIEFRISKKKDKKYDAIFSNGKVVSFGGIKKDGTPYPQFKDLIGAYSKYNHLDQNRRLRYYKRHGPIDNNKPYTADYLSKKFLW